MQKGKKGSTQIFMFGVSQELNLSSFGHMADHFKIQDWKHTSELTEYLVFSI